MSILRTMLVLIPLSWLCGCTAEAKPEQAPPAEVPSAPAPAGNTGFDGLAPAPTPDLIAKLEKADAQDGKTDKVVSNCAGCQLHMAGMAEHPLKVGGYTLHMCKGCAKETDAIKVLTALKIDG
ncbi:MAG: hypothetical protein KDC98_00600 [Planctomycetes bacterium]|nr:hypothetical protein [Planctomycetota bacterium]